MKCPVCGGKAEDSKTNLPVELETGLLYIKNIPAKVCSQCGEVFFDDEVAAKLEQIVSKAKKQKVEIEVISFQSAA